MILVAISTASIHVTKAVSLPNLIPTRPSLIITVRLTLSSSTISSISSTMIPLPEDRSSHTLNRIVHQTLNDGVMPHSQDTHWGTVPYPRVVLAWPSLITLSRWSSLDCGTPKNLPSSSN